MLNVSDVIGSDDNGRVSGSGTHFTVEHHYTYEDRITVEIDENSRGQTYKISVTGSNFDSIADQYKRAVALIRRARQELGN